MSQPTDPGEGPRNHVLLLVVGDVPEQWRVRARPASFIPLLPGEVPSLLDGAGGPLSAPEDEPLLRLAARGLSARAIASASGLSIRTVHRRIARLRELLRVETTAELASELSRRGF